MNADFLRPVAQLVLALCLWAGGAPWARGAEPEVLFEDDFAELDGSFPPPSPSASSSVEHNTLVVTVQEDRQSLNFYQSMLFQDVDLSVRVQLAAPEAGNEAVIGIGFWVTDYRRYYAFVISDTGRVAVFAPGSGKFFPVPWRPSSALKTDAGEWNELRVVTVGQRATAYLNGKKIASFKGNPPAAGSLVGPLLAAGTGEAATGRFSQLRVLAPSGPDATISVDDERPADPNVIYADDFAELDPGWGEESGMLSAKNHALLIRPPPRRLAEQIYRNASVDGIDASVNVKVSDGDPEAVCGAGIVFWASSNDHVFLVLDNGKVQVIHWAKNGWEKLLDLRPPAAAKFKLNAANELRVVTKGNQATLSINGVAVGTVTSAAPIEGHWKFGLVGLSGEAQAVAEFRSLVVRKPQDSPN